MRIVCAGGGPAGLYFAICAKRRDAGHEIAVVERDPRGATYGWGVGYWDDLLDVMYRHDRVSAQKLRAASFVWQGRKVVRGEQAAYLGGSGYSVNRSTLLEILTERAEELGVEIRHEIAAADHDGFSAADLIVAADGSRSQIRTAHAESFGSRTRTGRNRFIWLGTEQRFKQMVIAMEQTDAGWMWFYGYPSAPGISTCVVECPPETWTGLGLDSANHEDGVRILESVFRKALGGNSLISSDRGRPAQWAQYVETSNETFHHANIALVGDAAHTVHFTMGSGTGLAMMDACELAASLHRRPALSDALERYSRKRRSALHRVAAAGRTSMMWFENADNSFGDDVVDVAYALAWRYHPEEPWGYASHRAAQFPIVRHGRDRYDHARRWYLARRRGEPLLPPTRRS
ncbi:FAD-dependent monooxygenase [Rhodococcus daqingensis]|uniref:FAD-dependent monooxygenase n=1 Tax=Rhodococcus daqingensis TaxID=2479363 RepID=A0ABW2S1B6_9NOCA